MKTPQETGTTTIEMNNEGTTNGILSMISKFYEVTHDEERDRYVVGEKK